MILSGLIVPVGEMPPCSLIVERRENAHVLGEKNASFQCGELEIVLRGAFCSLEDALTLFRKINEANGAAILESSFACNRDLEDEYTLTFRKGMNDEMEDGGRKNMKRVTCPFHPKRIIGKVIDRQDARFDHGFWCRDCGRHIFFNENNIKLYLTSV